MAQYKADDPTYRRRALLTDGDERASYYSFEDVVTLLRRLDVQVFVVCLKKEDERGSQFNRSLASGATALLSRLASETGGVAFFPKTVVDLNTEVQQLIALLHQQYLITYKPTNGLLAGK